MGGSAIGAKRSCTAWGLTPATGYQFQLVAFRGTLNTSSAVFGALSNVASATTVVDPATMVDPAPVAAVAVGPAAASLQVGQALQLTATPKDANGNPLGGRVVTWASGNSAVATVNGSGLVTGVALGAATITATGEGQRGSAAITVVTTLPSGEPVFRPGTDVMVFQDNFDEYTSMADMSNGGAHPQRFQPGATSPSLQLLITGRGGSGNAARCHYVNGNPERPFFHTTGLPNTTYAPDTATVVIQYWFRINGNPGSAGGKWGEFWIPGGTDRTQFGFNWQAAITGYAPMPAYPLWHLYTAGGSGNVAYQPVGPYFNQLNNSQWHRATYLYKASSAPGAGDGVLRMWVDGIKIVDLAAAAVGVTPPGGVKPWAVPSELGQLPPYRVDQVNLGEDMNGRPGDFGASFPVDYDYDDFQWWIAR